MGVTYPNVFDFALYIIKQGEGGKQAGGTWNAHVIAHDR